MATSIISRPYSFSFSENEIKYVLNCTDPTTAGCAVEFEIYTTDIPGTTSTLLKSFVLTPNADGAVHCHLGGYLKSLLTPELPDNSSGVGQAITSQIAYFYIKYRQVTTATPNPAWTDDSDDRRVVILGGIEQQLFRGNNFFASYLPSQRPFLTWQPSGRYVFQDEKQYLTFLLEPFIDFYVNVEVHWTDGFTNTSTYFVPNATGALLWRIKTGAEDLSLHLMQPGKILHYYDVSIYNTDDDTPYLNAYRYYLEYRPLYSYRDIYFFGSLGNLETLRVRGEVTWSIESSGEDVEHVTGYDAIDTDRPQPQFGQVNQLKKNIYKGDAGWCRTKEQQAALLELLVSKGRFELVYGRWVGISNLKKSLDLRTTNDKKWSYPIEWATAAEDAVYTPDVDLGLGVVIGAVIGGGGGGGIAGLWGYFYPNAGITWYKLYWEITGAAPTVLVETSFDNITFTATSGTQISSTNFIYTFGIKAVQSHYVRLTAGATMLNFYLSKDYSGGCSVTNTTTIMTINQPIAAGVTWDLSLDGGATYVASAISVDVYTKTGLTSGATYQVTRRMYSLNGHVQVIPPFNITML